jgi:hypothetical protein
MLLLLWKTDYDFDVGGDADGDSYDSEPDAYTLLIQKYAQQGANDVSADDDTMIRSEDMYEDVNLGILTVTSCAFSLCNSSNSLDVASTWILLLCCVIPTALT